MKQACDNKTMELNLERMPETIWYIVGETRLTNPPMPFPTFFRWKIEAEKYARVLFPDDGPERRYARIMSREVM